MNVDAQSQVPAAPPALLDVRALRKTFRGGSWLRPRDVIAVRDVSFTLRAGRILAVVGESGSGKSTVARMIARLLNATSGEIRVDGADVRRTEPRRASLRYRRRVQMIFQDPFGSLNPARTIEHHLVRPLRLHGIARDAADARSRARELLATVGLEPAAELLEKYPHQLSGGQRQRVAIARALAPEPALILADEPTSMLDVSIRIGILNLMDRLKQSRDIAFLTITHDVASARYLADEILVMYAGAAVEWGPGESVIASPQHPYTRLLLAAVPDPARAGEVLAPSGVTSAPRIAPAAEGCPFAARCPSALAACRSAMPGPTQIGPSHWVRCHLYGAGAPGGIPTQPSSPDSKECPP